MEYNAEMPAAPAYNDVLTELFLGLPVMRAFLRTYAGPPAARAPRRAARADRRLRNGWGRARARRASPILDWREVPTYSEFVLFADYFRAQGFECRIADPREVEYRHGKLVAGDYPIDLIYKRVLISELVERGGLDHPVVRAVRDRAVCMVNPFRCKILHKKASLAVLSDERNADLFSREERAAIDAHIPWTRRVEERTTVLRRPAGRSAALHRQYRETWCSRRTTSTAAKASCSAGRPRRRNGSARCGRRWRALRRAGARRTDRASRIPAWSTARCRSSTACRTPTLSSSTATTWTAA